MPTPGSENMGVPELIYLDTEFTESISNDGSIENEIDLHLMNNDFSSIGILSETIHYTTSDIPAGLSLEIETTTDTTALLRLTGNANSHIESDDISNLNITFLDAAFNTYTSDLVVNNSANLSVNFFDTPPATMLWFGDTLFENEVLDDGSINTSITVELISETFTVPTGNIYDFTFNNVPSGLNIDVQATDNTHALISLTGHADNHADIDDINNIEIIFTDGAFTGASAANVNGHSKSDISVDFYQYYSDATDILSFSLNEQTGPAEIDDLLHTVDIEVHQGTNIYNLIPTFDLSASASAYVNSNLQESGVSVNNFGLPVVYNIIAEDGLTNQDWTITVNLSNKITELQKGIKIYPNPAKDFVNIELPNFENSTCKFYNASGKLLNQIAIDNKKVIISTQNWNKGIYWIKLITNDNIINQKIIIE
jgi:hypothetical protein